MLALSSWSACAMSMSTPPVDAKMGATYDMLAKRAVALHEAASTPSVWIGIGGGPGERSRRLHGCNALYAVRPRSRNHQRDAAAQRVAGNVELAALAPEFVCRIDCVSGKIHGVIRAVPMVREAVACEVECHDVPKCSTVGVAELRR